MLTTLIFSQSFLVYAMEKKELLQLKKEGIAYNKVYQNIIEKDIVKNIDNYSLDEVEEFDKALSKIQKDKPLAQKILHKEDELGNSVYKTIFSRMPIEKNNVDEEVSQLFGFTDEKTIVFLRDRWRGDSRYEDRIKIYDVENNFCVGEFRGYKKAISSDGKKIAVSKSGTLQIWNIPNQTLMCTFSDSYWGTDVEFSPNNKELVTVSGKFARIRNANTGESIHKIIHTNNKFRWATFSPDSRKIALKESNLKESNKDYNSILIWDVASGNYFKVGKNVTTAEFSRDSKKIIVQSGSSKEEENITQAWDVESGDYICELKGRGCHVHSSHFIANQEQIVAMSNKVHHYVGRAKVWNKHKNDCVCPIKNQKLIKFSSDGKYALSKEKEDSKNLLIWGKNKGGKYVFKGFIDKVEVAKFNPNSKQIAVTHKADDTNRYQNLSILNLDQFDGLYKDFNSLSLSQVFVLYQLCAKLGWMKKNNENQLNYLLNYAKTTIKAPELNQEEQRILNSLPQSMKKVIKELQGFSLRFLRK